MALPWLDQNGWLVLSVFFLLGLGAFVFGQNPSAFGHSSDEIDLQFPAPAVTERNCDALPFGAGICVVSCPGDPSPNTEYRALAGACISMDGTRWGKIGVGPAADSWDCQDNSHMPGQTFRAQVICVEVGK